MAPSKRILTMPFYIAAQNDRNLDKNMNYTISPQAPKIPKRMAGPPGFEPGLEDPKSTVLPLDHGPVNCNLNDRYHCNHPSNHMMHSRHI